MDYQQYLKDNSQLVGEWLRGWVNVYVVGELGSMLVSQWIEFRREWTRVGYKGELRA